jgi:hypothetical protein
VGAEHRQRLLRGEALVLCGSCLIYLGPPDPHDHCPTLQRRHGWVNLSSSGRVRRTSLSDACDDRLKAVLDGEVAGVQPDQGGVGEVSQVGLAAFRREEDVAPTPEDEGLRLVVTQELLPGRVERRVGPVVVAGKVLDDVARD